jgi:AraC-like DNA-binding protein
VALPPGHKARRGASTVAQNPVLFTDIAKGYRLIPGNPLNSLNPKEACQDKRREGLMGHGFTERVETEALLPGVVAQIVETHYSTGARGSYYDRTMLLRCRLWPSRINISAWQANGTPVSTGQMIFMPPKVAGENVAVTSEHLRSVSLKIDPDWFEDITGGEGQPLVSRSFASFDLRDVQIEQAMRRLSSELVAPDVCSRVVSEACSVSIAADLVRHFHRGRKSLGDSKDALTQSRIRRIEDFVRNYPEGIPTLSEIAADLGIGVGYLRQIYKNATGQTLIKFIDEMRICRAQALLCDRSLPLKLISHQLGFCTPSAFSFTFRNATNLTPREYRLRNS